MADKPEPPAIGDDSELLNLMLQDISKQRAIYQPGPYWKQKTRSAVNEIRRCGLANFRGRDNGVGLSCIDKPDVDVRHSLNFGLRRPLQLLLNHVSPINTAFDGQVRQTNRIANDAVKERAGWLQQSANLKTLLERYRIPCSIAGGCADWVEIDGTKIAVHYLALADAIDKLASSINFASARSFFEIGGGYGANVHLLVTNFPNIRKYVYLDIPPNLYIGTQYLRAHLPGAVIDYRALRDREVIRFTDDDALEILCIAPWQIEDLEAGIDIFHNANSFVEMPVDVIKNYAAHVEQLLTPDKGAIALISYDNFDLETSLSPSRLPDFFGGEFEEAKLSSSANPGRSFFYYTRKSRHVNG